jgi:auxin efflux carrier family
MALQERIIACGTSLTALGMVLRFIAGPAATAAAAAALGLRGDVLRATIIQVLILHQATTRLHKLE